MGLNRRSKHIELQFLWLQDHHKNGVIKVKKVSSLENPADIFTKHVSASTLAKHLPSCGLQELRVGEGDNYHHYNNNNHIFFSDSKFRKGFHHVQAQAPPQHLPQEAEEEIDNIFDFDICMIETEDANTTQPDTTTTSTERTAMQILAEVLQRKRQQQQKKNEQQQQQIQQQQVEQQVFREHHHPITSRLLTTTTSTSPTTINEEPQEEPSSERGLSLSSLSSCSRRKRRTSSPGRVKEEEEGERREEGEGGTSSSIIINSDCGHQEASEEEHHCSHLLSHLVHIFSLICACIFIAVCHQNRWLHQPPPQQSVDHLRSHQAPWRTSVEHQQLEHQQHQLLILFEHLQQHQEHLQQDGSSTINWGISADGHQWEWRAADHRGASASSRGWGPIITREGSISLRPQTTHQQHQDREGSEDPHHWQHHLWYFFKWCIIPHTTIRDHQQDLWQLWNHHGWWHRLGHHDIRLQPHHASGLHEAGIGAQIIDTMGSISSEGSHQRVHSAWWHPLWEVHQNREHHLGGHRWVNALRSSSSSSFSITIERRNERHQLLHRWSCIASHQWEAQGPSVFGPHPSEVGAEQPHLIKYT